MTLSNTADAQMISLTPSAFNAPSVNQTNISPADVAAGIAANAASKADDTVDYFDSFLFKLDADTTPAEYTQTKQYAAISRNAAKSAMKAASRARKASTPELVAQATQEAQTAAAVSEAAADAANALYSSSKGSQLAQVAQMYGKDAARSQALVQAAPLLQRAQSQSQAAAAAANEAYSFFKKPTSPSMVLAAQTVAQRAKSAGNAAQSNAEGAADYILSTTPKGAKLSVENALPGFQAIKPSSLDVLNLDDLVIKPQFDWWIEVAGIVGSSNDINTPTSYGIESSSIYGADVTLGRDFYKNKFSLLLRATYFGGSNSSSATLGGPVSFNAEQDISAFSLTLGCRYTDYVAKNVSLYGGFALGFTNFDLEQNITAPNTSFSYNGDGIVFTATIELGVQYDLSDRAKIFASYYLITSPNAPDMTTSSAAATAHNFASSVSPDNLFVHSVRLGVKYSF